MRSFCFKINDPPEILFKRRKREAINLTSSLLTKLININKPIYREASKISMTEIVSLLEDANMIVDIIAQRMELNPPGPRPD